ncbi:MAG: hypothetical protein EOM55_02815 [Clostridia bacterium]|nr:hypothetical protein [Clostridia bacterium]
MDKETANLLLSLKSTQSFEDIVQTALSNYGIFDNYDKGSHKTNVEDVEGLEAFCKQMYIDWGNILFYNYDNLNASQKRVANILRKNPEFHPKNMEKQSGTPFYDFIMSDYDKNFSKSGTRFAKLQDGRTIISDREEGYRADSFLHVYRRNHTQKVESRLYLNLMAKNIPAFCREFYAKCKDANLPFYFKFSLQDFRNDTFLAYSSKEDLPKYIQIIEEIKKEKPELLKGTETIKPILGVINCYIGYGDETSVPNESFTSIRNQAVKEAINLLSLETKKKFACKEDFLSNPTGNILEKLKFSYINISKDILELYKFKGDMKQVESLLSEKFDNNFSSLVLKKVPLRDITINGEFVIPMSDIDFLSYYSNYFATSPFINHTVLRANLAKSLFFENEKSFTPNEKSLLDSIQRHLINSIKTSLKEAKSKSMDEEYKVGNSILSKIDVPKGKLDETGNAILILAAANFLKNGIPSIIFGEENYNFCEISYDVYKDVLGKEKVETINRSVCDKNDIAFENVALNKSTLIDLKNHIKERKNSVEEKTF